MKTLDEEMREAERKAIDSLARYKFLMFGYWAGVWVHLNRFRSVVAEARNVRDGGDE